MNSEAIDIVRFILTKHLDFWMDELMLTLGSSIIIPVGKPDMGTQDVGNKTMRTNVNISSTPKVKAKIVDNFPGPINL
jgi:hypothetical protein